MKVSISEDRTTVSFWSAKGIQSVRLVPSTNIGSIKIQSGSPNELYNNPTSSYVAEFFGETNKFSGLVKNSKVETAVGAIPIDSGFESQYVDIHIRPQAIKLYQEKTPVNGVKGTVMASKLMGSYSFIHLSVLDKNQEVIHVHSHMPPSFNPKRSTAVGIEIDTEKIFIFPKD